MKILTDWLEISPSWTGNGSTLECLLVLSIKEFKARKLLKLLCWKGMMSELLAATRPDPDWLKFNVDKWQGRNPVQLGLEVYWKIKRWGNFLSNDQFFQKTGSISRFHHHRLIFVWNVGSPMSLVILWIWYSIFLWYYSENIVLSCSLNKIMFLLPIKKIYCLISNNIQHHHSEKRINIKYHFIFLMSAWIYVPHKQERIHKWAPYCLQNGDHKSTQPVYFVTILVKWP